MEYICGIIFCNAGNKIVLSRIDLYSCKRTGAGADTFRRAFRNIDTGKKWKIYTNNDNCIAAW